MNMSSMQAFLGGRVVVVDADELVEQLRDRDDDRLGGRLHEVDEVVVEGGEAHPEREGEHHVDVDLEPGHPEGVRRLAGRLRDRLDPGPEDLDVEGPGEERERDDRPAHVGDDGDLEPAVRRIGGGELTEREVEEEELDEGRRIAEELDVPLNDRADRRAPRALQPRARHPDHHAQDDARHRELEGHPDPLPDPGRLHRVVEVDEVPLRVGIREGAEVRLDGLDHPGAPRSAACRTRPGGRMGSPVSSGRFSAASVLAPGGGPAPPGASSRERGLPARKGPICPPGPRRADGKPALPGGGPTARTAHRAAPVPMEGGRRGTAGRPAADGRPRAPATARPASR